MWFVKGNEEQLGRICFGISGYVQGGMNEMGLFYDGATCPETKVPYDKDKDDLGMDLGEMILATCSNIQEAVNYLQNYNVPSYFGDHILLADASGDSLVVEWVENEMKVIEKTADYQIVTNFFLSNPDLGGYPCQRFNDAEIMLQEITPLTPQYFPEILSKTTQDWGDGGTKYSNIYDLSKLQVYVYNRADFNKAAKIDLMEALSIIQPGVTDKTVIDDLEYRTVPDVFEANRQDIPEHNTVNTNIDNPDTQGSKFTPLSISLIALIVIVFISSLCVLARLVHSRKN